MNLDLTPTTKHFRFRIVKPTEAYTGHHRIVKYIPFDWKMTDIAIVS